jgi:hypothetical protein
MRRAPLVTERSRRAVERAALLGQVAVATLAAVALIGLIRPGVARALDGTITSDGPLTQIITTPDLNCQVQHRDDVSFEFFGGDIGSCGTFFASGGTIYGPPIIAGSAGNAAAQWTQVSQAPVSGSGSGFDPYRLVTVVDAGASGIRLEQTDSYVQGDERYRTDLKFTNSTGSEVRGIVYRAADCFLQDSDVGYGRVDSGAPACVISPDENARIEQWLPITAGSHYLEAGYQDVWTAVGEGTSFPDTCACDVAIDNGAGLSWEVTIPANGSLTISHETFFSPLGRRGAVQSLRDAVPGPADISFDPVVIASSAVLATGIVFFVPFPATLFNSTLEEHYAEVTAFVGRIRRRTARTLSRLFAWGRRSVAARMNRSSAPSASVPAQPTAPAAVTGAPATAAAEEDDGRFWRTPLGILAFVGISALLYGFLDPTFGFDVLSLATFLGLGLGMLVMLASIAVPLWLGSRRIGLGRMSANALPGTLLIALGCVVLSRVADFQPGYLYGMIVGFAFTRELSRIEQGRLDAYATISGLVVAIVAWILLPIVRGSAGTGEQPFGNALLETACATVVVAGLEAAVFGMMPLRFLPGERVRAWNRRVWMGILGVATFAFAHILLNPSSGYLADSTRTSLLTVALLLAIFGGGSVLFWAWFRMRGQPSAAPPAVPPPASSGGPSA